MLNLIKWSKFNLGYKGKRIDNRKQGFAEMINLQVRKSFNCTKEIFSISLLKLFFIDVEAIGSIEDYDWVEFSRAESGE